MKIGIAANSDMPITRAWVLVVCTALTACTAGPPDTASARGPWYPQVNRNGQPIFGAYESRVPCIDEQGQRSSGCERLKLSLVLYCHPETNQPTTYLMSRVYVGHSDARLVNEGTWTVTTGTATDDSATVYALDDDAPTDIRSFWRLSQDVLFVLDRDRRPRRGTAEYGYALSRVD